MMHCFALFPSERLIPVSIRVSYNYQEQANSERGLKTTVTPISVVIFDNLL